FSPDEPSLMNASGADIRVPAAFPFETAPDAPVVYYRVRTILTRKDAVAPPLEPDPADRGKSVLDLRQVERLDLDFFFYYPSEEGFGGHQHDVESVEMKIGIWIRDGCPECPYAIGIARVNAKAHGVMWFDNTLVVDPETRFPITLLVEEGKHATCTDKNGDGYYTPGYDVNRRVNDAWGVRDVIRGGGLFTGGFESWFAKVRTPEDRIFPPLPEDSALHARPGRDDAAAPRAAYELRPFPRPELAAADPHLVPFIADKGSPDWPEIDKASEFKNFTGWVENESFIKSLSTALRVDGDLGVSFTFPLFIVKNFTDPLAGGWVLNRIYIKDDKLRDFSYGLLYTSSASRWLDGYFSVGYEKDVDDLGAAHRAWIAETGIRFRANIRHSPLSFMSKLMDFWGLRGGIQYKGLLPVNEVTFVVEVGSGVW
ncbi:MAG TPA: hypothetical protein VFD07_07875, partial [Candidatus Krumholzibacteria bacterium]|nr:hypothetical protein [Candidatus Krumholzibacteria bacterium]